MTQLDAPSLNMRAVSGKVMLGFSKLAYVLVRCVLEISTAGKGSCA